MARLVTTMHLPQIKIVHIYVSYKKLICLELILLAHWQWARAEYGSGSSNMRPGGYSEIIR
jgi:hypothetical protein